MCFVSERPAKINRDSQGRLHDENKQSIGYPSGWGLWHWHGVSVSQYVVERPGEITAQLIDDEQNAEVRRVMIERFGLARYVQESGAKMLSEDKDIYDRPRKLWRKEIEDDEPLVMLQVVNSSPEPDGTMKDYFLRVPPTIRTPQEAVAWTFNMEPSEYRTTVET